MRFLQSQISHPYVLSRAYSDVSIATALKAFVILAKSSRFLLSDLPLTHPPPWARSVIETAYFTINFLINSINSLYLRVTNTRGLHSLLMSTLYHLFNAISEYLIFIVSYYPKDLEHVVAAELLRAPFHTYVSLHTYIHRLRINGIIILQLQHSQ